MGEGGRGIPFSDFEMSINYSSSKKGGRLFPTLLLAPTDFQTYRHHKVVVFSIPEIASWNEIPGLIFIPT